MSTTTVSQAVEQVMDGCIDGVRGPGCAAIVMTDGRRYNACGRYAAGCVERFDDDGDLIERVEASEVEGLVKRIEWTCDELGGVYI